MRSGALPLAVVLVVLALAPARGDVVTETVGYGHAGTALEGYLAYDEAIAGERPGVLVVHEWWGLNAYAKRRARQLAEMGYVALATDMYGAGKKTKDPTVASNWSDHLSGDVPLWRGRARAGLSVLRERPRTDPERLAAIGYCFGGSTVLQLAYAGADLAGVVSFHGSFPTPPKEADVNAAVLVCHGARDPFVEDAAIDEWQKRMDAVGADWHMTTYARARHSFTNPAADDHGIDGVAYNETADRRSWRHMRFFFQQELFAE